MFFMQQAIRRRKNHTLQVMGGAHWDIENNKRPLNVFVGTSCSRSIDGVKVEDNLQADAATDTVHADDSFTSPHQTPSISTPTTQWDDDNGAFLKSFRSSTGATNF